jgi:hypothetical protein
MKTWLAPNIGEAIRNAISGERSASMPHLSCEAGGLDSGHVANLLVSAVREWRQEIVVGFFRVGKGRKECVRACILSVADLEQIVVDAAKTEEVVSIADMTAMGGCDFDMSPEESPTQVGAIELLVTAWGVHESMIVSLASKLNVPTFRQAKPPRLER